MAFNGSSSGGRWGRVSVRGPGPTGSSLLRVGLPRASPPHLWGGDDTQRGQEPWGTRPQCTTQPRRPLTVQDVELVCGLTETWGPRQESGWQGRGTQGGQAEPGPMGTTHRTWGRRRCGPRSGWPSGPPAQMHSGPSHSRGVSGLWDTQGSWGAGQPPGAGGVWGWGLCACHTRPCLTLAPPCSPLGPHTWAYLQGCLPGSPLGREGSGQETEGGGVCVSIWALPVPPKRAKDASPGSRVDAPYSFTDSRRARSRYRTAKPW